MLNISQTIASELSVNPRQVESAITLLDEGSTVPFISRYRKEVTGGLDDGQLRALNERLDYLRELEERRSTILKAIDEQGKLSPALEKALQAADTKPGSKIYTCRLSKNAAPVARLRLKPVLNRWRINYSANLALIL
ncbi:MAG: Tex-like N-terminal domain-containing protein [Thiolinea sp.]